MEKTSRLPSWFKMQRAAGENYIAVKKTVESYGLNTICVSGRCPNIGECWNAGSATFMILGDICTRACRFCATKTGRPSAPDADEPLHLAEAVDELNLKHCVITSVDRDDLYDRGAGHWAETVKQVKKINGNVTIECLIPDFDGKTSLIRKIIEAKPEIISHNIETVRRLTPQIRTKADYDRSLGVLNLISQAGITAKSGFMLGLGETGEEILQTINDIFNSGCTILTIGQYLQPSFAHMEAVKYYTPDEFDEYRNIALNTGFRFVESSPHARSSYHAVRHV
ncbi:MAG: lipoyl synthase [Bacteroidales bacterium]|jgi:lipoic acid synthetase|nr:lipoyl synthase [Bacteroidales bacterium]